MGHAGNATHSKADKGFESYQTPPEALMALMGVEPIPSVIWEPAAGDGNLVKVLRSLGRTVHASDIQDTPGADWVADFLASSSVTVPNPWPEAVMTNPPFSRAEKFVERGLQVADDVYLLLRVNFLEGGQRDPLRDVVLDKSGLRRVYVFRERLPMMHRAGWKGPKASSQTTFAWFCWRKGYRGKSQVQRISWKNPNPPLDPLGRRPPPQKGRCRSTMEMFDA